MSEPWTWVALDTSGRPVSTTGEFASRDEAEAWLAESWQALLESGAASMRLMAGDSEVYSMGLHPQ